MWQVLCIAGVSGFGTAIGIHPVVGYNSVSHLGPAVFVAGVFVVGLLLTARPMLSVGGKGFEPLTLAV